MKNLDERTILLQIKNGNLQNFEILYKKYYNKVFFLTVKMIGNEKLAEDISQEVFIDAMYGVKNLKNLDIFSAWLTKIAISKVNSNIKKLIYQKNNFLNENYSTLINVISDNLTIEEILIKKEVSNDFLKKIVAKILFFI